MTVHRLTWSGAVATIALAALSSCGGTPEVSAKTGATASSGRPSQAPSAPAMTVRTATPPDDDCGWIPVAEVEAIVGKLAGPPTKRDGCRYMLVMPDQIREAHEKEIRDYEAAKNEMAAMLARKARADADPRNYALTLSVEWSGAADMMRLTTKAVEKLFASDLDLHGTSAEPVKPPNGWDDEGHVPYGYTARLGHIRVTVQAESPDLPKELMPALAAKVRDQIPDLPFPVKNPYQVLMDMPANADPCGLITRTEAEAVLGSLAVDPYHSSSYFPPLAHPDGHACAYFTPGHHVFVVMPRWTRGERNFNLESGIGGLVGQVMPKEEVILKGPWDKSQITMEGGLQFLKGDRLLEVSFAASSTNRLGALKLATLAMQRLMH